MKVLPKPKNNMYTLKHLRDLQRKEGYPLKEGLKVISKSTAQDEGIALSVNLANVLLKHGMKVRYK